MSDHRERPVTIEVTIDRIMDIRESKKTSFLELKETLAYNRGYKKGYDKGYEDACDECIALVTDMEEEEDYNELE